MDHSADVRDASPLVAVAVAIGLSVLGLLGSELFTLPAIVLDPSLATAPETVSMELRTLFLTLNFLGMAAIGAAYLAITGRGWSYVDLRIPTTRDLLYVGAGIVGTIALYVVASVVITLLDLPASDNQIVGFLDTPTMVLIMIAIVFFLNAPAEEFLFRNVVQKRLAEAFSDPGAVVLASLIFALIHLPVYLVLAESLLAGFVPVVIVFGATLVFGSIYATTGNLLVPILAHAVYNALQFGLIYVSMVYDIEDPEGPTGLLVEGLAAIPL